MCASVFVGKQGEESGRSKISNGLATYRAKLGVPVVRSALLKVPLSVEKQINKNKIKNNKSK